MSQADLEAGHLRAIVMFAFPGLDVFKKELRESDLNGPAQTNIATGLAAFWTTHGAVIQAAPGIPGLRRGGVLVSTSAQAGREVARARNGLSAFAPVEWGAALAVTLTAAAVALGPLRITASSMTQVAIDRTG